MNIDKIQLDIIITYVDGNDKKWFKQKKKDCNIHKINRYNSNLNEIKYCVDSIEKYLKNKFRNIYFVTNNGKLPKCIKPKKNYITLLYSDLVGYRTYNSTVIESHLHKIDGLSEYYLYFNDDFIINKKLNISDFIDKSGKLIWYEESSFLFRLYNKYPILSKIYSFRDGGCNISRNNLYRLLKYKNNPNPIGHCPRIFKKSMVSKLYKKFQNEMDKNKKRLLRSENDFPFIDAFCFYYLKKNKLIFSNKYKTNILIQFDNNFISKIFNHMDNSTFICIEDYRINDNFDYNVKNILENNLIK